MLPPGGPWDHQVPEGAPHTPRSTPPQLNSQRASQHTTRGWFQKQSPWGEKRLQTRTRLAHLLLGVLNNTLPTLSRTEGGVVCGHARLHHCCILCNKAMAAITCWPFSHALMQSRYATTSACICCKRCSIALSRHSAAPKGVVYVVTLACALNSLTRLSATFAKAVKSPSSGRLTVANANAALEKSGAQNSLNRLSAALPNAVKSLSSGRFTVANAHAVLARFCALNALTRRSAAFAKAVESFSSGRLTVANAHAMLERSGALNSLNRCGAALAKAVKSFSSGRFTVANAHAVLARFCALNALTRRSAAFAKAVKSF